MRDGRWLGKPGGHHVTRRCPVKQSITINADRVTIRNVEKQITRRRRDSARVDASRQMLQSVPNPVELGGERHVLAHSATSEVGDVLDRRSPQRSNNVQVSNSHTESSPSKSSAALHGLGVTASRLEEPGPTPGPQAATAAEAQSVAVAAPSLYYQDRLVTLYHGDCLAAPELWTKADVMVTDPPYGLQALAGAYGFSSSKRGSVTIANDLDTTVRDAVLALWGDKPVAMFGTPRLEEPPGGWTDRLVWDKAQLGLNGGAWRYAHETIFVRGPGWRRISDASSSIMRHASAANRAYVAKHIHSKPERLLADLIGSAPEGLLVDPFAGGGSTIAAARALGRPIIAFELEQSYCEAIVERISSRLDLFGGDDS